MQGKNPIALFPDPKKRGGAWANNEYQGDGEKARKHRSFPS